MLVSKLVITERRQLESIELELNSRRRFSLSNHDAVKRECDEIDEPFGEIDFH